MDHNNKDASAVDSGHFPDTGDASHVSAPTPSEIAARAHQLWLEEGQPHGSDERHWLQAEQELRAAAGTDDANERADSAQA